jgi:MoaA/NifB/PqqE/SkfB family radical SAM enzyme
MSRSFSTIEVDDRGRLVIPPDAAARMGIVPGSRLRLREDEAGARIGRSTGHLARLYVEPTSACNLDCRACIRSAWEEPVGSMSADTWARIMRGLEAFGCAGGSSGARSPTIAQSPAGARCPTSLFLGGYGEPLMHPDILVMVGEAKAAGLEVQLITNGLLLDANKAERLASLGLDRLWVSIDCADEPGFSGARGGMLGDVMENIHGLNVARERSRSDTPRVGISVVATRDTVASLPAVLRLGQRLVADRFIVSNILPHTRAMNEQALYRKSFYETDIPASDRTPLVELPRMELNRDTEKPLAEIFKGPYSVSVAGQRLVQGSSTCPFVEKGSMAIRWDGTASPCLPLLHTHASFLQERERRVDSFAVGNLTAQTIAAIWADPTYVALREKLLEFDFAPCTQCNSCEEADGNQSDCFGNGPPACGACLWAQGFIQCP